MKNLTRLAALETPARDLFRLRTEAVAALGEPDVRPVLTIGQGAFTAWDVAFRPDGKALAINDEKEAVVRLWDIEADRPIRDVPRRAAMPRSPSGPTGRAWRWGPREAGSSSSRWPPGPRHRRPLAGPGAAIGLAFDRAGGRPRRGLGRHRFGSGASVREVRRVVVSRPGERARPCGRSPGRLTTSTSRSPLAALARRAQRLRRPARITRSRSGRSPGPAAR